MGTKPKRRLSNYLLDRDLQLRYVAVATALASAVSGALGFLIWRQGNRASEGVRALLDDAELASGAPDVHSAIMSSLSSSDQSLVVFMAAFGLSLVVVLSVVLIVFTHKVAGPLYNIGRHFDRWGQGSLGEVHNLRRGDLLKDFFMKFRSAHYRIRERHLQSTDAMARFVAAADKAGESHPAVEVLREHAAARKNSLS